MLTQEQIEEIKILEKSLVEPTESLKDLSEQLEIMMSYRNFLMKQVINIKETIDKVKFAFIEEGLLSGQKTPLSPEELEIVLFEDGSVSGHRYYLRDKIVEVRFPGGIRKSGYHSETKQSAFEIALTYNDKAKTKETCDFFETALLPHILPLENKHVLEFAHNSRSRCLAAGDKFKRISIFEHTLSEYGIYSLYVVEPGMSSLYKKLKIFLTCTRYSRISCIKEFATLREAFDYVEANHWYDGKEVSYDDDD